MINSHRTPLNEKYVYICVEPQRYIDSASYRRELEEQIKMQTLAPHSTIEDIVQPKKDFILGYN